MCKSIEKSYFKIVTRNGFANREASWTVKPFLTSKNLECGFKDAIKEVSAVMIKDSHKAVTILNHYYTKIVGKTSGLLPSILGKIEERKTIAKLSNQVSVNTMSAVI